MGTIVVNMMVSALRLFFKILAYALASGVSTGRDPTQPPLYWTSLVQVTTKGGKGAILLRLMRLAESESLNAGKYYEEKRGASTSVRNVSNETGSQGS